MRPPEPDKKIVEEKPEVNNNVFIDEDDLESVEDYVEKIIHIRTKKVGM